jgi:hypothetical protein
LRRYFANLLIADGGLPAPTQAADQQGRRDLNTILNQHNQAKSAWAGGCQSTEARWLPLFAPPDPGRSERNSGVISEIPSDLVELLVGVAGFEPAASSSRTKRAAKLRYTPATAREV